MSRSYVASLLSTSPSARLRSPRPLALALSAALGAAFAAPALAATASGDGLAQPAGFVEQIDALVQAQMSADQLPGLTLAATRDGTLLLDRAYGYADVQTQRKMATDTRIAIGSSIKALAIGGGGTQLLEDKGIDPKTKTLYGANGVFGHDFANDIARGANRYTPIVELDIGADDRTYAWYHDGTYSQGATNNLDQYAPRQPYALPAGRKSVDVRGIAIAGNGVVYSWYDDARTRSSDSPKLVRAIGTASKLDQYSAPTDTAVDLPPGKTSADIVGIAIAKSNDHVYVWYQDGTYSQGTSMDFDYYEGLKPYTVGPTLNGSSYDLRGLGIASNDHVYAWFGNGLASSGMSHDLDRYIPAYAYSLAPNIGGDDWRAWYAGITIQNLLDHRAGFTRSGDVDGAARLFGVGEDQLTYKQVHQHFLRTRPLLGAPGAAARYSNHGFGLWTLLIEKISGKSLRDYLAQDYFGPAGVAQDVVPLAATVTSRDSQGYRVVDGQWQAVTPETSNLGLAAGGYRSTARAATVLMAKLDAKYSTTELDRMGWGQADDGRLEHNGGLSGGMSYVVMFPDGYVTPEGKDLSRVHVAVLANRWGSTAQLATLAREVAKRLP